MDMRHVNKKHGDRKNFNENISLLILGIPKKTLT